MHAHGAFGDRETETGAAATLTIACILGPIERTKNRLERVVRYAVATIPDANHGELITVSILLSQRHFDRRSFRRVTNRIAHHVFDRAAQQLFNAIDRTVVTRNDVYRAIHTARFEVRIVRHLAHERSEINLGSLTIIGAAFETRERQQLADHLVEIV